jgi:hypothetical protein
MKCVPAPAHVSRPPSFLPVTTPSSLDRFVSSQVNATGEARRLWRRLLAAARLERGATRNPTIMAVRGWVYVITNKALIGQVKVGYSTKDPVLRAKELDSSGVPHRYEVMFDALVESPRDVEQRVHEQLSQHREGKEWFRCSVVSAISAIRAASASILAERSHPDVQEPSEHPEPNRPGSVSPPMRSRQGQGLGPKPLGMCSRCTSSATTTYAGKPLCTQHGILERQRQRGASGWLG